MQVTETLNSGLKREIKVTVPAGDLEEKLLARLNEAKAKVRINGFRPGKVPIPHLRKVYGKSFMAEVVNEILSNSTRLIVERGEKAAMQPEVKMTEDEKEAEKILAGGVDFEFELAYEVIPAIEIKDPGGISVTRPVYDVSDSEIEEQVARVAESARSYEIREGAAESGDRVTIDYVGSIDGQPFANGSGSDQQLVIGSKEFIPGFEDQLIGVNAGDETEVTVTFPDNYSVSHLAGREATFAVTVKEVAAPGPLEINDETAQSLGVQSLDRLREIVRGQMESQFGAMTRQKVKRQILDQLDEQYKFEAPSKLVEAEFTNIWNQVTRDLEAAGRTFADEDTTEDEARAEYMKLAERRVRLGLVLAEIGEKAGVTVSDDEMQRAMFEQIRRFPADRQKEVFELYRSNPNALAAVRAPLFEEKVIDHLLGQIAVTDKHVSKEELMAEDEEPGQGTSSKSETNEEVEAAEPIRTDAKTSELSAEAVDGNASDEAAKKPSKEAKEDEQS